MSSASCLACGLSRMEMHMVKKVMISLAGRRCFGQIGACSSCSKPWADLKSRASLHQPPIRVVLAEELKVLIQRKASEAKPIGNENSKLKHKPTKRLPLQLRAEQLAVPNSVFKQQDGHELGQIATNQIAPGSQGVVLANIIEVLPYFSLTEPVSNQGVALLILEHDDPRLPPQHRVIKCPVQ